VNLTAPNNTASWHGWHADRWALACCGPAARCIDIFKSVPTHTVMIVCVVVVLVFFACVVVGVGGGVM
jgi:hypothetical protein